MSRFMLLAALILLIVGTVAAEPKHVDGGWLRSDEMPEATPTAAPPDEMPASQDEPEAADGGAWGFYVVVALCGLLGLAAIWNWLRRDV